MTTPENWPKRRPHPRLVAHDIRLEKQCTEGGAERVVAKVDCERRGAEMNVDDCRFCDRFARVETHEAGYVMLCRSTDEETADRATAHKAP